MLNNLRSSQVSWPPCSLSVGKAQQAKFCPQHPNFQPDTKGIFLLYHNFLRSYWLRLSFGCSTFIIILCFLGLGILISEYFIYLPHNVSIPKYSVVE